MPPRRVLAGLAGAAGILAWSGPGVPATAAGSAFVVAPLPKATGVPYAAGTLHNEDVEPGIGVGGDGVFWVGSNIDPNTTSDPRSHTALSGEDIWKSTDGGLTYQWVADPFNATMTTPALGGEDSDLTVAPEKNTSGTYNVYATSLYVAASNLAISQDAGRSFTVMQLGGVPAQDRPWLSADGPCVFYLTYHQLPLFEPVVNRYDVCSPTDIGMGFTLNPVQNTPVFLSNTAPGLTNAFNKPIVDTSPSSPYRHTLYVPMEACDLANPGDFLNNLVTTAEQVPTCPKGVVTQVEVAVSSDGGNTFNDYVVAKNSNGEQQVWPTSIAVDRAGVVYTTWSDNTNSFFSRSSDQGRTWSRAVRINSAPALTTTYPTVASGPAGLVDIAFYGAGVLGNANDATKMGLPGSPASTRWHLYWVQSTDGGAHFAQQQIGGVNHTGELCTKGSTCSDPGSRNLYDDFGVAISPTTSRASIAFDADQPLAAAPGSAAVDPFTAYATELGPPQAVATPTAASTPTPSPSSGAGGGPGLVNTAGPRPSGTVAGAILVAAAVIAPLTARRRRRGRTADRDRDPP